jgi:8-oxo-dGTP pyrophosphatase MutT (NUDIX family)
MSPYYTRLRERIGDSLLLIPGVAAVIHDNQGQLLLQEKSGEVWSLPAGAIEPGESPEEAVRREVLEETGLIVAAAELLAVLGGSEYRYVYPNGHAVEYTIALYRCSIEQDTGRIIDAETVSLEYFSADKMPSLALPYPKTALFGDNGEVSSAQ